MAQLHSSMKWMSGLVVLALILSGWVERTALAAAEGTANTDVSAQVAATFTGLRFNRATQTFDTVATLTNTSPESILAPLELHVTSTTPESVTLHNASGTASDGHPYVVVLPAGELVPGATAPNVVLRFNNPSRVQFTFTHRVMGAVEDMAPASLRVLGINPSSAGTGRMVQVNYEAPGTDASNIRVVLGGQELNPESATADRISFRVPSGLKGDYSLFLRAGDLESNTLLFSVSNTISVVSPETSDLVTVDGGSQVAVNLVMIFVAEGFDLDTEANAAAAAEGGEVVGRIDPLRARQLRLPTTTFEQLEAAINRLRSRSGVEDVIMDMVLEPEIMSINWGTDPDEPGQRASNRVEQGAQAYIDSVHPTVSGAVRPYFGSISVFEEGVHFNLADYSGYATRGGIRSGGIALYASDCSSFLKVCLTGSHGSNVVGLIAAGLGVPVPPQTHAGSAGLLSAIGLADAHGGFNVKVNGGILSKLLSEMTSGLESGVRLFNLSSGVHRCDRFSLLGSGRDCVEGLLQSSGQVVNNRPRRRSAFDSLQSGYDRVIGLMERDYPNAILVVSAGNGNTDAGDRDGRLFSAHPSEQVIVVGAHSNVTTPVREGYSNYGERVDIAAAGRVRASWDDGTRQGTSYSAPLVTATIAAMRSIEPDLTPTEVRDILRKSALPIDSNNVTLRDANGSIIGSTVFTRALTASEVGVGDPRIGKGARLNVEGAIKEAIARRQGRTRRVGDEVNVTITGRETVSQAVNVTIPSEGTVFDRVDIMFLVDVSGSYGSSIAQFKTQAVDLVNAFVASGTDVHTGIASFSDFPISPWGSSGSNDYAYRLDQKLTGTAADTIAAINRLQLLFGNDTPESQLEALFQLAAGSGRTVAGAPQATIAPSTTGWREGSLRIVFLATDASFHNPEAGSSVRTPGYPGPSWTATLNALKDRGIRVYGLERGFQVTDVRRIVEETDGEVFQLAFDSRDIVAAVSRALEGAAENLDIALVPNGDFAGIIRSITPERFDNVARGETKTFTVTFSRGDGGPGEHVFVFRLEVVGNGTAVIEEIPVIVQLR